MMTNDNLVGRYDAFLNAMTFGYFQGTRFYITSIMRF